jgi:hypothetical protein
MKFRILLPGAVIALALLAAACGPPPPLRDDTLLHDENLFSNEEPCAVPCWRGITPGETAWGDALTIIEDAEGFTDPQVQESPDNPSIRQAAWQETDGAPCCQMLTEDGETVSAIFLRTAPQLTMADLVEQQGEPEYVLGIPYTDTEAIMNLIYPDVRMVVYAFVAGAAEGELSESSEIIAVLYLTEKDMDLLTQTNNLHTWDGFQSYKAYEDGEFEVTPSVTLTPTSAGE